MVSVYGVVESSLMTPVGHSVEGLLCEIEPDDRGIMRWWTHKLTPQSCQLTMS